MSHTSIPVSIRQCSGNLVTDCLNVPDGLSWLAFPDFLDADSLFRPVHTVPGLTRPYQYLASQALPFSMHVEDTGLDSVNTLMAGAPKVWSVLNQQETVKLTQHLIKGQIDHGHW